MLAMWCRAHPLGQPLIFNMEGSDQGVVISSFLSAWPTACPSPIEEVYAQLAAVGAGAGHNIADFTRARLSEARILKLTPDFLSTPVGTQR